MQLGMLFALDDDAAEPLLAARGDAAALTALVEAIEEGGVTASCETEKAWDPISCALAPAGESRDPDEWPAYGVILGDEDLTEESEDLMLNYLEPAHVPEVAAWLATLDEEAFGAAYDMMPEGLRNAEWGAQERAYAWDYLRHIRVFFAEAAEAGRHVVFHVNW